MWSPCSGPTLGAVVIGLAAQSETAGRAAMVMAMFSLGAATPILAHRLRLAVGRIFYARRQLAELLREAGVDRL
jgi:cytochrome c biogenesis protein CcdA